MGSTLDSCAGEHVDGLGFNFIIPAFFQRYDLGGEHGGGGGAQSAVSVPSGQVKGSSHQPSFVHAHVFELPPQSQQLELQSAVSVPAGQRPGSSHQPSLVHAHSGAGHSNGLCHCTRRREVESASECIVTSGVDAVAVGKPSSVLMRAAMSSVFRD